MPKDDPAFDVEEKTCRGCGALYIAQWPAHCLLGYTTSARSRIEGVPIPEDPDDTIEIPPSRIIYGVIMPVEECPGPVTAEDVPSLPRRWESH